MELLSILNFMVNMLKGIAVADFLILLGIGFAIWTIKKQLNSMREQSAAENARLHEEIKSLKKDHP